MNEARRRKYLNTKLSYFMDAFNAVPSRTRVDWGTASLPHILSNKSFSSLYTAAAYVSEKSHTVKSPSKAQIKDWIAAFELIQRTSGLSQADFLWSAHPWLEHVTDPIDLSGLVASVPARVRELVSLTTPMEKCTDARVSEYDRQIKARSVKPPVVTPTPKGPHYPMWYMPTNQILPEHAQVDVMSCETLVAWLQQRAVAGPLRVYAGTGSLLWVSRDQGEHNQTASDLVGTPVTGEAWQFSASPIFPRVTNEHDTPSS